MKTFTLLNILIAFLFSSCTAQTNNGYIVKGDIKGIKEGKIVIAYFNRIDDKLVKIDSAQIENGLFEMQGLVDSPLQVFAMIESEKCGFPFFMENSNISIQSDMDKATSDQWGQKSLPVQITGSKLQTESEEFEKTKASVLAKISPLSKAYDEANEKYREARKNKASKEELKTLENNAYEAKEKMEPFYAELEILDLNYIEQNSNSLFAAYLLSGRISSIPLEKGLANYNKFTPEVQNSYFGKMIKTELDKLKGGSPGSKASEFTTVDIKGKTLSLSDFRGQYVLIDFWASWCKPCRASNPHLIKLYKKYHTKGVEFIGISDDDSNPKAWHKAVEKDGVGIWYHVLRGLKQTPTGFDKSNDITEGYAVHSLPTKILIDPQGIIVGRYGGGREDDEAMDRKFETIFKNK